jgi:hypothetical protein
MITSADNPAWPMDVAIDAEEAGLRAPSKVHEAFHLGQPADSA